MPWFTRMQGCCLLVFLAASWLRMYCMIETPELLMSRHVGASQMVQELKRECVGKEFVLWRRAGGAGAEAGVRRQGRPGAAARGLGRGVVPAALPGLRHPQLHPR